jgi:hypothetical protein
VRAGLVDAPDKWPWSSTAAHISGHGDGLVKPEPLLAMVKEDWLTVTPRTSNIGLIMPFPCTHIASAAKGWNTENAPRLGPNRGKPEVASGDTFRIHTWWIQKEVADWICIPPRNKSAFVFRFRRRMLSHRVHACTILCAVKSSVQFCLNCLRISVILRTLHLPA